MSETQRGDNWVSIVPVEARLENVRSTLRTNTALVSLTFYLMAAEHFCLGGSKVPPANVNISSEKHFHFLKTKKNGFPFGL